MLLLALVACPSEPDDSGPVVTTCEIAEDTGTQIGAIDDICKCEDPWASIGTGIEGFEDLDPAGLEMVHGPQGGWHLPAALRVGNTRNVIRIWAQVTDVETGVAVTQELNYHVQIVGESACEGAFPNMYLYLDTRSLDPELTTGWALSCREVHVEMCVTDTGGRDFCTEAEVKVLPDPTDVASAQAPECESSSS
ncbi:MAG TPA: hypothetical protein QGF58_27530 [Myxococcota bacterium]|nr:hypothetical protein [Myxococcota bacterium]